MCKVKDLNDEEFSSVPMKNRSFVVDWSIVDAKAFSRKSKRCQLGRQHRLFSPSFVKWIKAKDLQEDDEVDDVGARGIRSLEEINQRCRSIMLEPIKEEFEEEKLRPPDLSSSKRIVRVPPNSKDVCQKRTKDQGLWSKELRRSIMLFEKQKCQRTCVE
ncbi:hypothetical protein Pint_27400 [Pistacia integerrima]|uniref:Uncharacterized protein n=1 Tax=Pistacia integerrima TaxID=434235 RepID=A0ACC0YTA5_9ROSI|nr:hypothetical protein Pint_27400 [Pistacia integerrima]